MEWNERERTLDLIQVIIIIASQERSRSHSREIERAVALELQIQQQINHPDSIPHELIHGLDRDRDIDDTRASGMHEVVANLVGLISLFVLVSTDCRLWDTLDPFRWDSPSGSIAAAKAPWAWKPST